MTNVPEPAIGVFDTAASTVAERTPGEQAAHGTAWLTAAHGSLMVAGYLVAVILARDLGPALYGVYGIVYSVLLGVELIGRLGIPQAMSRLIAERRDGSQGLEATGITLTALIFLPVFIGFWYGAPWLAVLFNVADGARLFRFAAVDIPFFGLYFTVSHILNGRRDFAGESLAIFLYALAKVVGILILVATAVTIEGALLVNAAASVVALAFLGTRVGAASFRPTLRFAPLIIRLAFYVGLFTLGAQLLAALDLWALNALGGRIADDVKGLYVGATNLARLANVMAFVMTAVLIPTIAEALSRGDVGSVERMARGAARFLVLSLLPVGAIAIANAGDIMAFVYSETYRAGAPFLAALIISHGVLFTMFVSLASLLVGLSFEEEAAFISVAVVPIAAGLDYGLIIWLGAMGAPLAAILAMSIAATGVAWRIRRHVGDILGWSTLLRAMGASTVVWVVSSLIHTRGLWLLIELAGVSLAYAGLVWAVNLVRAEDLALFRRRSREA